MRCLSKSWKVLLSEPSFVKSHLHRSLQNKNDRVLLVFPYGYEPFTEYSSSDQSPHFEPTNLIKHIPHKPPMQVIGAVNGLICLCSMGCFDIQVWNPSLSAISTIPRPLSVPSDFRYGTRSLSIRFGFDPKTDDYKIVRLLSVCNFMSGVKWWLAVQVYSMRKKSWELVTDPFPSHVTSIFIKDEVCGDGHDGHIHWENRTKEHTILAFDLGLQTFREMPLPDSILDSWHTLTVLSRKLCEVSSHADGGWEVWVMEEYGVHESWVRRHVISQFDPRLAFYGFTLRNELLLYDKDNQVVLYDPNGNTTKLTPIMFNDRSVEYMDSLVWI